MGNPGARLGKQGDLGRIQLHAMRMPDIRANPAKVLCILPGPAPESGQTIGDILFVFRQMGVQHHPFVAGQHSRLSHQVGAD